ncbi:Diaminopimelate epimerase-like protein [Atractiella rhizophila]|nr:Diaminopimelate epimerase-like protein [Atractiella rhizophila]
MKLTFSVIDAFTSTPFSGNPASVILLSKDIPDDTKQKVAREFNLAETAFLLPLEGGTDDNPKFQLRWFTPTIEVPLCGHATLASAHYIFSLPVHSKAASIQFETVYSGTLYAHKVGNKIELDFPVVSVSPTTSNDKKLVTESVERASKGMGENVEDVLIGSLGQNGSWLVRLKEGTELEGVKVIEKELGVEGKFLTAITVPCPSGGDGTHFHSRIFAPNAGIDEDPVTGAAHAMLGPYWFSHGAQHLAIPVGDGGILQAKQVSPRGGKLELVCNKDGDRVRIRGESVTVSKGEMEF